MHSDSICAMQMEIGLTKDKTDLMANLWPSHYGTLYDMGIAVSCLLIYLLFSQ